MHGIDISCSKMIVGKATDEVVNKSEKTFEESIEQGIIEGKVKRAKRQKKILEQEQFEIARIQRLGAEHHVEGELGDRDALQAALLAEQQHRARVEKEFHEEREILRGELDDATEENRGLKTELDVAIENWHNYDDCWMDALSDLDLNNEMSKSTKKRHEEILHEKIFALQKELRDVKNANFEREIAELIPDNESDDTSPWNSDKDENLMRELVLLVK